MSKYFNAIPHRAHALYRNDGNINRHFEHCAAMEKSNG